MRNMADALKLSKSGFICHKNDCSVVAIDLILEAYERKIEIIEFQQKTVKKKQVKMWGIMQNRLF